MPLARLDYVERLLQELANGHDLLADPLLGNAEKLLLGAVENLLGVLRLAVGLVHNPRGAADQVAQHRLVTDDLRVVLRVDVRRDALGELDDVVHAADLRQQSAALEFVAHHDEVDRLILIVQFDKGLEEKPVILPVKPVRLVRPDEPQDGADGVAVQHHRAQEAHLRLDALRRDPLNVTRRIRRIVR